MTGSNGKHPALTLEQVRARFKAREKSINLVLDGGLLAEHEALGKQLEAALASTRTSLADDGGARGIAEQIQQVEVRIAEATVTVRVRGIGRNQFRALMADHPDDRKAFNAETFPPALIAACSLDPVMTEADARSLGDLLTDAQFDALFDAAWQVCRETGDDRSHFNNLASITIGS